MTSVHFNPGLDSKEVNGSVEKLEEAKVEIDDGKDESADPDTMYQLIRMKITPFVMSFGFRMFGVVLIIVDIVLVIVDLSLMTRSRDVGDVLETVSLIISLFFLTDVLLRVYVEGFKVYFSSRLNIIDACIVVITLVVTMIYTFSDLTGASLIP
uniref:phosphatidylinositol 3,4,5-trisphosphate 3-phosphatase TPTE2-like n=1 Tax=Oncorhynchus gorbuscha TaxID=8017 RepID=UPI001EAF51A1